MWPVMRNTLNNKNKNIIYAHVRKFVTLFSIFWTVYLLNFALKYIAKCMYSMGTKCAPLVAVLIMLCYERHSNNSQADVIRAFNSTSRYLDDLLNIDNHNFE